MVHPSVKRALIFIVALVTVFSISQVALSQPALAHNYLGWGWHTSQYTVGVSVDANGYGSHAVLGPAQGYCLSLPWNDKLTGIDSHTGVNFYVWLDGGCNGGRLTFGPNYTGNVAWPNNDKGTSYCIGVNTPSNCGAYFP